MLALIITTMLSFSAKGGDIDRMYNSLFDVHNATVEPERANCIPLPKELASALPKGRFIIPSLGQFSFGDTEMLGALDAYGKLSSFAVDGTSMCFAARLMETSFLNASRLAGKVAPGLLFYETEPPRGYSAMKNLNGYNDNSYVNTIRLGGAGGGGGASTFYGITDSKFAVEFDPVSLRILGDVAWDDHLDLLTVALGSAHPLPEPGSVEGCMLFVRPQEIAMLEHEALVYRVCPSAPTKRVKVASLKTGRQLPYFHSFGVTPRFAILPLMHITFDFGAVMLGGGVGDAFKPYYPSPGAANLTTPAVLLPLGGGRPLRFELPGDVFFLHAINAYEEADAVVFDVTQYGSNFFADTRLSDWRNATKRDGQSRGIAARWRMHLSGPKAGKAEWTRLSAAGRSTDFPKINPRFHARPYCFYWAVEWFHDDAHMSRMAVVRQDVCKGGRSYWYREGAFPSEPTFVPRAHGGAGAAAEEEKEDDGYVLFTLMDGPTGASSLVVLNASTMATASELKAPEAAALGFTTHGQWYGGI